MEPLCTAIEIGCTFVLSFGQMNWKICRKLIYLAKIVCKLCCDLKNEIWSYRYCSGSPWTFNNPIFDFDCGSCIFTNHTSILTTAKHIQKNSRHWPWIWNGILNLFLPHSQYDPNFWGDFLNISSSSLCPKSLGTI